MRLRLACVVVGLLAACPAPATDPVRPQPGSAAGVAVGSAAEPPAEAPAPTQDELLAAIQKAMNELDEGTQSCWAAAATERFDIEGELTARIEIGDGTATVSLIHDTANNPRLASCVQAVLTNYPWAPPLRGQTIQLPFRFRAPTEQNVIDRRLVTSNGQGKVSIAVLLDDLNTGNDAASMFEVALAAGGGTGLRVADRAELWHFLGAATISGMGGKPQQVSAGDMVYVAKGGAREVSAASGDVHAVVVVVPGGREGAARAGALPTPPVGATRSARVGPKLLAASAAKTFGPAQIFAEPATIGGRTASASLLTLRAGVKVAEHVHANETELLYVLAGSGTMTVDGVELAVTPTSVIQIPPNTKHAFTAAADVRAVQFYTPAGPEQRFKARP